MLPLEFRLEEYICIDGSSPYQEWFDGLDRHAAIRVARAEFRMAQGNLSALKWIDGIGEYKIDWGPGYRIYVAQEGHSLIILLGGGIKKTQDADVKKAKKCFKQYKSRKKAIAERGKTEAGGDVVHLTLPRR